MSRWPQTVLGDLMRPVARPERVEPDREYRLLGVRLDFGGAFLRETKLGSQSAATTLFRVRSGDFIYSRLFAWRGAFGTLGDLHDGCHVSGEFPMFAVDPERLDPAFLLDWLQRPETLQAVEATCSGSTPLTRNRFKEPHFLALRIPLPPLSEQRRIVAWLDAIAETVRKVEGLAAASASQAADIVSGHVGALLGEPDLGVSGSMQPSRWVPLGELVTDVADRPHVTPRYVEDGIPFVTALNVAPGKLTFLGAKHITEADHQAFQRRAVAESGDVLITKDGTIGQTCLVDTDRQFSFFVSVALVKPKRGILDGAFLVAVLRTPYLQRRMAACARGDMIRHLVLREIAGLPVPILSIRDQAKVARIALQLGARIGETQSEAATRNVGADRLLASALGGVLQTPASA